MDRLMDTFSTTTFALRCTSVLAWREIVRFFRQRSRVVASIGTPLVFWLLFGAGLSQSFRLGGGAGPLRAGDFQKIADCVPVGHEFYCANIINECANILMVIRFLHNYTGVGA